MTAQLAFFYGVGEKNRILAALQENHALYLTTLRSFAREIAMRKGTVTIDDVREHISAKEFPMPSDIGVTERVFGVVFATREFVAIRQEPTRRVEWAKRVGRARSFITVYRLDLAVAS